MKKKYKKEVITVNLKRFPLRVKELRSTNNKAGFQ